jgi:hypothetical protein
MTNAVRGCSCSLPATDCTVAESCVSLIPGIAELLADKGYDTDAFRTLLKERGIKTVIPGKSNRKKRIRYDKEAYKVAMSSSAASVDSKIGGASPHATISSREITSRPCASSPPWRTGFDLIESEP